MNIGFVRAGLMGGPFARNLIRAGKDVRLGVEMARAWGLDMKAMEAALAYYKEASAAGHGKEDCNAVYKIIGI